MHFVSKRDSRRQIVLAVAICAVLFWTGQTGVRVPAEAAVTSFRFGVTHTESDKPWGAPDSIARASSVIQQSATVENVHIMGWGSGNPEPSPDVYDFSTLDRRMAAIRSRGTTPVITLCCAPDWMKGGQAGLTDWSRLPVAPISAHFNDFANLAITVARRYPWVKHFQVWNELKGFWSTEQNQWNVVAYTQMYNQVYTGLKAVDPANQVGGPYVVMASSAAGKGSHPSGVSGPWGVIDQRALDAVQYWLDNKKGADFLAVDGGNGSDSLPAQPVTIANQKFAAVTRWLRSRSSLPIWWSEIYPEVPDSSLPADAPARADALIDALFRLKSAGASVVLLWQPEADPGLRSVALYSSTASQGGGQPLYLAQRLSYYQKSLFS